MIIAVLIKQVPDTETKIRIKADATGIEENDIKYIVSPYDEFAIEEALQIKQKLGQGEVTVISVGPERSVEALRTALAMGADKAIHVDNESAVLDSFQTSKALSGVIKKIGAQIVICGKQAIDGDNGQVVQMVAEILDWPQVMIVEKFEPNSDKQSAKLTRRVSGGAKEVYEASFPLIFGCEKGINTPRYASLPGIMKAKTKPIEKLKASEFVGSDAARVKFDGFALPPERAAGRRIEGEPAAQAAEVAKLLREEAKVI